MKMVLKKILLALMFSTVGMCWFAYVFYEEYKGSGEWLWGWIGVLMSYICLYVIINSYIRNAYHTLLTKILIKIAVISFSFGTLGLTFGVIHQMLGP